MYFALYRVGEIRTRQILLYLPRFVAPPPSGDNSSVIVNWHRSFGESAAELCASRRVNIAFRITRSSKTIERILLLSAREEDQTTLESLAGSYLRLNAILPGTIWAADRERYNQLIADIPDWHARIANDSVKIQGIELATPYLACGQVSQLLAFAAGEDDAMQRCFYQANIRRFDPGERIIRQRNAACGSPAGGSGARETVGFRAHIQAREQEMADSLGMADFLMDEYIGTESGTQAERMQRELQTDFVAQAGSSFPPPEFDVDETTGEAIQTGLSADCLVSFTPIERAAIAADRDIVQALLLWQPPTAWDIDRVTVEETGDGVREQLSRIERTLARIEEALAQQPTRASRIPDLQAPLSDVRNALRIYQADPDFLPAKTRQILEGIVNRLVQDFAARTSPTRIPNVLNDRILLLEENDDTLPGNVVSYLHTLRIFGNKVVHPEARSGLAGRITSLSELDIEITLLMSLRLVEWYLLEYNP